jgi:hypothetical protein
MSLDGLRAWIGEVERKLGARTRVFLVLLAIAIGASGAAIYLALEADDDGGGAANGGASVEEVQSLREQVELEGGGDSSALEAQISELRSEVAALKAEQEAGASGKDGGTSGSSGGGGASEEGGVPGGAAIPEFEAGKIPESVAK